MSDDGLAAAFAQLVGLPAWLPRVVLRTAAAAIAAVVIISPDTAQQGLEIFADRQAQRMMEIMKPLLTS